MFSSSFYKLEPQGTERASHLLKVTQLVSGGTRVRSSVVAKQYRLRQFASKMPFTSVRELFSTSKLRGSACRKQSVASQGLDDGAPGPLTNSGTAQRVTPTQPCTHGGSPPRPCPQAEAYRLRLRGGTVRSGD